MTSEVTNDDEFDWKRHRQTTCAWKDLWKKIAPEEEEEEELELFIKIFQTCLLGRRSMYMIVYPHTVNCSYEATVDCSHGHWVGYLKS